ncbi:MAG: hypothetical protein IBX41_02445 [Methanophagales archaeon]|nr:hypothetical protein [Methanophagales archaeon]
MKPAHEYKENELYEKLEPYIGAWFRAKYRHFTPPQKYAIVEIIDKYQKRPRYMKKKDKIYFRLAFKR